MCSLPLPCQHGSHHPFPSKDANVIEYLLTTVSGKMKNPRKAIALEPLSHLCFIVNNSLVFHKISFRYPFLS